MRRRREALSLVLVLCAALLLAEGMLRALSRVSVAVERALAEPWEVDTPLIADPREIYRGNPLYVQHDARGYRNPSALERADVVVFGDSHTYGSLVPDSDAVWPRVLERLCGQSTYSMALPGIGATHARIKLDQAMALQPRAIVMAPYFGNDLFDAWLLWKAQPDFVAGIDPELRAAADRLEAERPLWDEFMTIWPSSQPSAPSAPPGRLRQFLSRHVKLYGLVRSMRWRLSASARPVAGYFSPEYEKAVAALPPASRGFAFPVDAGGFHTILTPQYRGRVLDDDDPRIRLGYEVLRRALVEVFERARAAGIRVLVVPLPTKEAVVFPRVADPASIRGLAPLVADEERLLREWTDEMDRLGIEHVEVLSVFRTHPEPLYFEHVDGHPNAAGHRLIAELVAAKLATPPGADRR